MNDAQHEQKRMGTIMQVLAWMAVLGLLTLYFGDVLDRQRNPNTAIETAIGASGVREVQLRRNRMGHYVTAGTINGQPVEFLLDTGATGVAIPAAVAERLNLPRGRSFVTHTANGTSRSYQTRLNEVGIGDIRLRGVDAAIAPGLQMREVLLGMSFLKYIEFTQRGNVLTLRQYPP